MLLRRRTELAAGDELSGKDSSPSPMTSIMATGSSGPTPLAARENVA